MRSESTAEKENNRSRDLLDAPQGLKDLIKFGMEKGWIEDETSGDRTQWAFSRDVSGEIFELDHWVEKDTKGHITYNGPITMEQIMQEIKKNEKKGIKFRFETAKEAIAAGYHIDDETKKKYGL